MHEEISSTYQFDQPTDRMLIGKLNKKMLVGNVYNQKQMHVRF